MKKFGLLIVPLLVALSLVLVVGNDEARADHGSLTLGPGVFEVPFGGGPAVFNGIALIGSPFPPFIDPLGRHGAFDKSLIATSDLPTLLETKPFPFGGYSVTVTVPPLTALGDYGVTVTFEYTEMDTFIFRSFERSATVRVLAPPTFEGVAFTALDGQHGALEAKLDALEVGAGLTVADINDALSTALGPLITDIGALEAKLDAQGTAIGDLLVLAFASDDALSALEDKADALVNEIDDLVTPLFGGIADQLGELEFATSAIEGKLDALGPQINGKLDALELKANELGSAINFLILAAGPSDLKLDSLAIATSAIESKLDNQGFDLSDANTGITDLQVALADHDSGGDSGLGLAVAALESKLDAQSTELAALGAQLEQVLAFLCEDGKKDKGKKCKKKGKGK